jgi:voltage-gated potassium channel Kch
MSVGKTSGFSHKESFHYDSLEWWGLCLLAVAAAAFGACGLWQYEMEIDPHRPPDFWSLGYYTLQMFVIHSPHLAEPPRIPWTLHAGRWTAAAVVLMTITKAITKVFRSEWRLFWARRGGGHVVICGLGRVGMHLAHEFRRKGARVVAIETSSENAAIADDRGVAVITGDACLFGELRRAAANRAKQVIAVCDDEQINVAIAAKVGELVNKAGRKAKFGSPLECWIFIPDARLRRVFQHEHLFPYVGDNYRVNVRGLDLFRASARKAFTKSPLDFQSIRPTDPSVVHLVIVGFGPMGQSLALQAARIGYFANSKKLKITVVEQSPDPQSKNARYMEFLTRFPQIRDICDFTAIEASVEALTPQQYTPPALLEKQLTTFAFCCDSTNSPVTGESELFQRLENDDPTNLSLAIKFSNELKGEEYRFLVFQTRTRGFGALFPNQGRGSQIGHRMNAFGMLEETCSLETLLHEHDDIIARTISGKDENSWAKLSEEEKDRYRHEADHMPVKVRALGYRIDRIQKDKPPVANFNEDSGELLAKTEDARRRAEIGLKDAKHDGEKPGAEPKSANAKEELEKLRSIPDALKRVGYGIYPAGS